MTLDELMLLLESGDGVFDEPEVDGLSHALRSELQVMVRERPQTAAGVLRNWLGSAS